MRGRILALTLALCATLGLAGEARAHRLKAACRFFPGRMVRVESWFDNGETPKTGQVEVAGAGGDVLVKGRLSSQGLFLFDAPEAQPLQVVVEAGEGHRAEVAIRPEEFLAARVPDRAGPAEASPGPPRHDEPFPVKDALTGAGLLIAVAAFVLSLRNARALRDLRRGEREHD